MYKLYSHCYDSMHVHCLHCSITPNTYPPPTHIHTHTHTHTYTHRRDIGLEKFFKKSLLNTVKRKNIRTMVVNTFQHYESLSMEGCIFQFFSLLTKSSLVDVERFSNCAVGVSPDGKWIAWTKHAQSLVSVINAVVRISFVLVTIQCHM